MTPKRVGELRRKAQVTWLDARAAGLSKPELLELIGEVERLQGVVAGLAALAIAAVPPGPPDTAG